MSLGATPRVRCTPCIDSTSFRGCHGLFPTLRGFSRHEGAYFNRVWMIASSRRHVLDRPRVPTGGRPRGTFEVARPVLGTIGRSPPDATEAVPPFSSRRGPQPTPKARSACATGCSPTSVECLQCRGSSRPIPLISQMDGRTELRKPFELGWLGRFTHRRSRMTWLFVHECGST